MTLNAYRVAGYGFEQLFKQLQSDLINQPAVSIGEWQSQRMEMQMRELHNVTFSMAVPDSPTLLGAITGAHLPWAEDHFKERVSGLPMNPAPSEAWWPFAKKRDGDTNRDHKSEGEAFSHTYPERIWPKHANGGDFNARMFMAGNGEALDYTEPMHGIRFDYGDLRDVVNQLVKSPYTRQAYLPIWFPEDTGAVHGKRVPCTLGYQFTIREYDLSITYFMRSTDLLRHFQDDIYMAGRLAQWVADEVSAATKKDYFVHELTFHTVNLHVFEADVPMMKMRTEAGQSWPTV